MAEDAEASAVAAGASAVKVQGFSGVFSAHSAPLRETKNNLTRGAEYAEENAAAYQTLWIAVLAMGPRMAWPATVGCSPSLK